MSYVIDVDAFTSGIAIYRDEAKNHVICEVWPQGTEVPDLDAPDRPMSEDVEAMRLARLFSVAPEMLAALEESVKYGPKCYFEKGIDGVEYHLLPDGTLGCRREECWRCQVRSLIAFAKGD